MVLQLFHLLLPFVHPGKQVVAYRWSVSIKTSMEQRFAYQLPSTTTDC